MRPVGRPPLTWQSALAAFLKRKRITAKTRQKYKWNFSRFFMDLEEAGLETHPSKIKKKEIDFLLDVAWADLEVSTREWYTKIFAMFLRHYENDVIDRMEVRFPQDMRVNVDWLSPVDSVILMDAELTPLQEIIAHLEFALLFRRVEVIRLKMSDIKRNSFDITGKNGKLRTVPFHPDTRRVLSRWLTERERLIAEARAVNPRIPVPDNVLIYKLYKHKPKLGAYSENGDAIDDRIDEIEAALGITFSNHTLRRTGGRLMWQTKRIPIKTISQIYGHSSIETTKRYIGVNLDDMDEAMTMYSQYQNELRRRNN